MDQGSPTPQINVSKIPGGGGFAGALFTIAGMLILLVGGLGLIAKSMRSHRKPAAAAATDNH